MVNRHHQPLKVAKRPAQRWVAAIRQCHMAPTTQDGVTQLDMTAGKRLKQVRIAQGAIKKQPHDFK